MELSNNSSKAKVIASGIIPFIFVILMMAYIFGPGADLLDFGILLPETASTLQPRYLLFSLSVS